MVFGAFAGCNLNGPKDPDDTDLPSVSLDAMTPVDDSWRNPAGNDNLPISQDELLQIIRDAIGDKNWNGNYKDLTDKQKEAIEKALEEKGYDAEVTDNGVEFSGSKKPTESTSANPSGSNTTTTSVSSGTGGTGETVLKGIKMNWAKTFGGSGNDIISACVYSPDGSIVVAGTTYSSNGDLEGLKKGKGSPMGFIAKFNSSGELVWKNAYSVDGDVFFNALTRFADGGYAAAGYHTSSGGSTTVDALLVRFSEKGEKVWEKTFKCDDGAYFDSAAATSDGGFIAGGKASSNTGDFAGLRDDAIFGVIMKFDGKGNTVWKRAIAGDMHSSFTGIDVNKNGDIYATCYSLSSDYDFKNVERPEGSRAGDTILFKFDKNGRTLWTRCFGGSGNEFFTAVEATADGGCVIGGNYNVIRSVPDGDFKGIHNAGLYDAFLIKYNSSGKTEWTRSLAGLNNDFVYGITQIDGGYAVTGHTHSSNRDFQPIKNYGGSDSFVCLLDNYGTVVSIDAVAGSFNETSKGICASPTGELFIVGTTTSTDNFFALLSPKAGKDITVGYIVKYTPTKK